MSARGSCAALPGEEGSLDSQGQPDLRHEGRDFTPFVATWQQLTFECFGVCVS